MVATWNAALAWQDIAGLFTLTASSEAATMPVTNLRQEDTRVNWRTGAVTSVSIFGAAASNQSADIFSLLNTNLLASGTYRLRLSSSDPTCVTGIVKDTNVITGGVDPLYKDLHILLDQVYAGWKYFRIDLVQATGVTYLEAGFIFISTSVQFAINYAYGAQRTPVDPSIHQKMDGGQVRVRRKPQFFRYELSFEIVTELQRWSVVESIDLLNGKHTPILLMTDRSSSNPGRDFVYGFVQEVSPVVSVQGYIDGAPVFGKTLAVDQRL